MNYSGYYITGTEDGFDISVPGISEIERTVVRLRLTYGKQPNMLLRAEKFDSKAEEKVMSSVLDFLANNRNITEMFRMVCVPNAVCDWAKDVMAKANTMIRSLHENKFRRIETDTPVGRLIIDAVPFSPETLGREPESIADIEKYNVREYGDFLEGNDSGNIFRLAAGIVRLAERLDNMSVVAQSERKMTEQILTGIFMNDDKYRHRIFATKGDYETRSFLVVAEYRRSLNYNPGFTVYEEAYGYHNVYSFDTAEEVSQWLCGNAERISLQI